MATQTDKSNGYVQGISSDSSSSGPNKLWKVWLERKSFNAVPNAAVAYNDTSNIQLFPGGICAEEPKRV